MGLKSTDAQSTTAQTVAATRQYDAFGNVAASIGAFQGPFGYGGGFGYQEDGTELGLVGHRLYDGSTGRFLTRDPIKDERNWYAYCDNNPTSYSDADGLSKDSLPGPDNTTYRMDPYQEPKGHGNMHIWHGNNQETIISPKGGYVQPSKNHQTVPLPKHLRKPYRKIIAKFIKKAAKVVKPLAILVLALEGPKAFARSLIWQDEIEYIAGEAGNRLTETTTGMRRGLQHARIDRWLGED